MPRTVLATLVLLPFFLPTLALADTIAPGQIEGDVTWTKEEGPYITNSVYIPAGSSLTILPGTIIKVAQDGTPFYVNGTLTIGSESGEDVIITSIKDDTVGGDTNNDGNLTIPNPGDWRTITMNGGAHVTIAHAIIEYGGATPYNSWTGGYFTYPLVENNGGILTIDHTDLAQSGYYGVLQNSGTTTITNSTLSTISKWGVYSAQGYLSVASTTFDTMERGIAITAGALEIGGNTFTHIASHAVSVEGYPTTFQNHGGNIGTAGLFISQTISGTQTLPKDGLVYVMGNIGVPSGTSLTILPGVIAKVPSDGSPFYVNGTLTIGEEDGEEVIITSMKDDSVGGDTNGDGSATIPGAADWRSVIVSQGGVVHVNNTTITYGGATPYNPWTGGYFVLPVIQNNGGTLMLDHTTVSESGYCGVRQESGTTTITNSTFVNVSTCGLLVVQGFVQVASTTFDTTARGIATYGGALELGGNIFTNLSSYAVSLEGQHVDLINHGGNTGTTGMYINQTVQGALTLPKDGLVYVMGNIAIPSGTALTVMPGAVVKVLSNTGPFNVDGTLTLGAEGEEQVTITSIVDDTVGGDTNGDGTATAPSSENWRSITLSPGSHTTITNTTIRYGGASPYNPWTGGADWLPTIRKNGGTLMMDHVTMVDNGNFALLQYAGDTTITNSEIARTSRYGIFLVDGALSITDSSIHDSATYGIFNATQNIINATHNWWGSDTGPSHPSNPGGTGDRVSDYVDYGHWLISEPHGSCTPGTYGCNSNVLFLPGIMGSRLFEDSGVCGIFNNEKERWVSSLDCDHERLAIGAGGQSLYPLYTKEGGDGIVDDTYNFNIYQSFMEDLKEWKDDDVIADYVLIPYDWRLSLEDILQNGATSTDGKLSYGTSQGFFDSYVYRKLTELVQSSRTGKVTIVAHSNGGLVTKALIQKLKEQNDPLYDKIDNIIFVGVPQSGTPDALGNLLHGGGIGPLGSIMDAERVRGLIHEMPFAYNLLPSQEFVANSTPLIEFEGNSVSSLLARYGNTIDSYDEFRDYLLGGDGRVTPLYADLASAEVASSTLLRQAESVHTTLDNWLPAPSTVVYEIAGWGLYTPAGLRYAKNRECIHAEPNSTQPIAGIPQPLRCEGYRDIQKIENKLSLNGDQTVMEESAHLMEEASSTRKWWVDLPDHNTQAVDRRHKDILEIDPLRMFIKSIVTGSTTPQTYITSDPTTLVSSKPHIKYELHSPLNIHIYDQLGNHTGISTTTGLIEEKIEGSSYFTLGHTKTVILPVDTPHTLKLAAYASGSFTLDLEVLQGDTVVASTTFEAIPTVTTTEATLVWNPENGIATSTILSVDFNSDDIVDATLAPTVGGTTLYDMTPPETHISFSTSTQNLIVQGIDENGNTTVRTTATSTLITDQAGNTLLIPFINYKEKNHRVMLSFNSLVYNGIVSTIATTTITYKWNINNHGEYTMFAAHLKTGSTTIETHYLPKKNVTIVMQKPTELDDLDNDNGVDVRIIKSGLSGLVVPSIVTRRGGMSVIY